jgi:anaerobic selenocysteine-containing dehydrogenase
VTPAFFAEHSVAELAGKTDFWMDQAGRLTHPMVLREGDTHYTEISWDEAFELIATELNGLASPDEAVFYTSGRASNEAAFLYQLFARQYGTNNLPDCSNMCHESSGAAMMSSVGVGTGTGVRALPVSMVQTPARCQRFEGKHLVSSMFLSQQRAHFCGRLRALTDPIDGP